MKPIVTAVHRLILNGNLPSKLSIQVPNFLLNKIDFLLRIHVVSKVKPKIPFHKTTGCVKKSWNGVPSWYTF